MPVVPLYGSRKVGLDKLPGARLQPVDTPEAEGAGLAAAQSQAASLDEKGALAGAATSEKLAGLGGAVARVGFSMYDAIQREERDAADETALLTAKNQLADWKAQTLYDPNAGAFTKKGKDAFGLPEDVATSYRDAVGTIGQGLTTDKQQRKFQEFAANEWQSVDIQVRRHVYQEIQGYRDGELKSAIGNMADDAIRNYQDPVLVGKNLGQIEEAIRSNAPAMGLGPEAIDEQLRAVRSGVHVGVINQLLANDQSGKAQSYFDAVKDQIKGDQQDNLAKALETSGLRKQAQTIADTVSTAGTLSEQLAKVRDMNLDPKLRDEVEGRLEHTAAIVDRAQREAEERTMRGAYDVLDKTGDVTKIPAADWAGFSGGTRSALLSYADKRTRGVQPDTDYPTYYGLLQKAADDGTGFMGLNLLNYRAKLDDGAFKQLADLQMHLKMQDKNSVDKVLGGFRSKSELIDDTLTLYGIDPKSKPDTAEGKAIAQLRRMVDERVDAAQATGVKVTNTEVQNALDTIMGQSVGTPGSWWGLLPFSSQTFFSSQKRLIDLQPTDVPADMRPSIERALRDSGRPVTDATVLDTYMNILIRRNYKAGK